MKTKKLSMITLVIMSALTLTVVSCKKDKVKGCTTSTAVNFKSDAEEDDGSCTYSGKMVIWWGKTFSDSVQAYGVTAIKVYVDGAFISTNATTTYWTSAPSCGANGSITVTKNLGTSKSKSYSVQLKDQSGNDLGTESVTVTGNECFVIEIPWPQ